MISTIINRKMLAVILAQVIVCCLVEMFLIRPPGSTAEKSLIYHEDFADGPGGWHYLLSYAPWNVVQQKRAEWKNEWRYIESHSPWALDGSHVSQEAGYLQLVGWVSMNSLDGGLSESSIDLTNAHLSFKIKVKDLDLKGGHLYFWFQHQYEHGLVGKRRKRADFVLTQFPIDTLVTPKTWSKVTLPLKPLNSAWTCLRDFLGSQTRYGCVAIEDALREVNVCFGFMILPVDPNNLASGTILLDDICISRLIPQALPLEGKRNMEKNLTLTNRNDKTGYCIGTEIGRNVKNLPININLDILEKGIDDAVSGREALLTEREIRKMIPIFFMEDKWPLSMEEKLLKNKKQGEDFLAENKKKENVKTLPSGLQYEVIKVGTGKKPKLNDTVTTRYRGTLIDGTEFINSYSRGKPASFQVGDAIPGWIEALQMMGEGAKWKLFIPPNLAFGEYGAPWLNIELNATLIFEIELLSVQ